MSDRKKLLLLLLAFYAFRLMFGLFRAQLSDIDQYQTYLIGLKCYTTGTWPWFGPDVNGSESSFKSQIPGAMEGVFIGWPFYVLPLPEAPFILLNLLSLAGVALLAWYIHRRLPQLPYAWVFIWVAICPWSIQESTTLINPAYTFLPSILFFIGFMESLPFFSLKLLPPAWANAAMGFSFFWIMQFHFSYVYLAPLILFSLAVQARNGRLFKPALFMGLGSLPPLAFLVPTYLKFGLARGNVASGFAVPFNWDNVGEFWTIVARFFSLVSFELPRFIGVSVKSRMDFLANEHPYLLVPGLILWGIGILQPFFLVAPWFGELRRFSEKIFWGLYLALVLFLTVGCPHRRWELLGTSLGVAAIAYVLDLGIKRLHPEKAGPHWRGINLLMAGIFAMVYASFWFTVKMPLSHIYFIFFPLIMTYSCYVWASFKEWKYGPMLGKSFLILGLVFQLGYAVAEKQLSSIYNQWPVIKQALDQKDYRIFGERRPESIY
ncbi:MAG TPA: hypothetical protein VJ873_10765 [bacterium]|nr:hypothetical protein [bacterium]